MTYHRSFLQRSVGAGVVAAVIALCGPLTQPVSAGGLSLSELNGSGLGVSFSDGAAASDASTAYINSAGLTRIKTPQGLAAADYILVSGHFTNEGSTVAGAFPLSGGNGGNGGVDVLVPSVYYARPLTQKIGIGFSLTTPFGLATKWPSDWIGRYQAIKSRVTTVNLGMSAGIRVNDQLSLGGGLDIQRADADLSNAIDFGLIGYTMSIPGFLPQNADGQVEAKGHDTRMGYHLGILFELDPATRIGLTYRSKMVHHLSGDAHFSNVPAPFVPSFSDQGVRATITLPEVISANIYHDVNRTWSVMANYTWTRWSQFNQLAIDFSNATTPDTAIPEDWRNTSELSAGVYYHATSKLTLKAGAAYDQTSVPNATLRSPQIPDRNRRWLSAGISYIFSPQAKLDVGYAHLFMGKAPIDNTDSQTHELKGYFDISADILSAQFTWNF